MKIIRSEDARCRQVKEEELERGGERRHYYVPQCTPFEIIKTEIDPDTDEKWHAHQVVREATLVVEGEVVISERDEKGSRDNPLRKGDFAVFDVCGCHRMRNTSRNRAVTLTFKFLGEGKNQDLFEGDTIENCEGPVPRLWLRYRADR